ncbi:hypothetical protein MRB53_018604 [Persea americana]|uniref:Uncharacterized protein n=1 Tax=Persea americana TaxID=3435 RepID=A0ACC2M8E6_PERAE|nr:hypothetical protein MRB53_018604 [Persea americana]
MLTKTHLKGSPPLQSLWSSSLSRPRTVAPSSSTRRPHHHLPLLPPHAKLIPFTGDLHESFYIGPTDDNLNQWPAEDALPCWRPTMELYHKKLVTLGRSLIALIALALNLDEDLFEKVGACRVDIAWSYDDWARTIFSVPCLPLR